MMSKELNMDTCCFCKQARLAILIWSYIKLVLMLLVTYPLYGVLIITIFYGEKYELIFFWSILASYPVAVGFVVVLIVAAHSRQVKMLRVCLYYLIIELILATILVPWALNVLNMEYSTNFWATIFVITGLTIAQGIFSIIMVNSEIKKLSDANGLAHEAVGYRTMTDSKEII